MTKLLFRNTDGLIEFAAVFVNDFYIFRKDGGGAVKDDGKVRQAFGHFFKDIETKFGRNIDALFIFRALLRSEFIGAVAGADGDCQRVHARTGDKLFHFFGASIRGLLRIHLYIVFNACELAEFRFDDDASFMSIVGYAFCQFRIFIKTVLRTVDHDRGKAAVNAIFTRFKICAVI